MKHINHFLISIFLLFLLLSTRASTQSLYSVSIDNNLSVDYERAINAVLNADGTELLITGTTLESGSKITNGIIGSVSPDDFSFNWNYQLAQVKPNVNTFQYTAIYINDILQVSNGYLFAGYLSNQLQAVLLKMDAGGMIKWYKRYNPMGVHAPGFVPVKMAQRPDGNIIQIGYFGQGYESGKILWMRTDDKGENPVFKTFGAPKDNTPINIFALNDNNSMLCTSKGNFHEGAGDVYPEFITLDPNGIVIEARDIILPFAANAVACIQTNDGGYALVGNGLSNSYLMKLDANLQVSWFQVFSPAGSKDLTALLQTSDGGYLVAGNNGLLLKTDANGAVIYSETISGSSSINALVAKDNDHVICFGTTGTSGTDLELFHLDVNNGLTACTSIDAGLSAFPQSILFNKPGFIITSSFTNVEYGKDSITLTSPFTASTVCQPLFQAQSGSTASAFNIYPNPAADHFTIQFPVFPLNVVFEMTVTNELGQIVFERAGDAPEQLTISTGTWNKGIYFIHVHAGEVLAKTEKIILE